MVENICRSRNPYHTTRGGRRRKIECFGPKKLDLFCPKFDNLANGSRIWNSRASVALATASFLISVLPHWHFIGRSRCRVGFVGQVSFSCRSVIMSGKGPKAIVANKVVQEVNGETLVYDTRSHRAYCLNEVSSLVWKKCDGKTASAELSKMLSAELNSDVPDELVWLALDQLFEAELVEKGDGSPSEMRSISRREVIRRVGLASAVALPVVASIVAPPAAAAQSCLPTDASCTSSSQCCSNCCRSGQNLCKPGGGACLP